MVSDPVVPAAEPAILLYGVNYRAMGIAVRERFAVHAAASGDVLRSLLAAPAIDEAVVFSTCNRTEVIAAADPRRMDAARREIESIFEQVSGLARGSFDAALYRMRDEQAVQHLFRVAAGLDSMIVGEPQVLGQLKAAYRHAQTVGATGALLNRLFHRTFGVAKAVRTRTGIGRNAVSVCYAARELAQQIFGDLSRATVMLIGAGETGALAMKHFRSAGARHLFIANKTFARATELAQTIGGAALDLAGVEALLPSCDIIIGASMLPAGAPPLISLQDAAASLAERPGNPQFYIDLGVPRNFDPALDQLADVFLYNLDDLQRVVAGNVDARVMEVKRAELIVGEEVKKFARWRELRPIEAAIRDLRERHQEICATELRKTVRRMMREGLPLEHRDLLQTALDDFAESLLAKALHQPLSALKRQAAFDPCALELFKDYFLQEPEARESLAAPPKRANRAK